jgi:tetratricopeptide (TPR) repeat protein
MPRTTALFLFLAPTFVLGADPDWKDARTRLLHGNFEEAKAAFEVIVKGEKPPPGAVIGLSRTHQSVGDYDKALEVVEAGLKKTPDQPDLLARQADILFFRGRWDEAEKSADKAIVQKDDHFLARWVKAEILRDRGDWEKADEAFRWFVRTYTQRSNDGKDIKDPEELALVGRAGVENANAHGLSDQFEFILNTMYADALKEDADAWYIELQAGELLLEKYNRGQAFDAFDKALKINPKATEAMIGKARASLQLFEIKEAEQFADQALKINPKLPSALRVKADLNLMGGDLTAARKFLDSALAVNPRDESTLGRVAAVYVLQHKPEDVEKLAKEIAAFDPKPGQFYCELAEAIEGRRLLIQAEKYYNKAIELRPKLAAARNGLGLLYMRLGREADARKILDEAFEADKFNVRVANSRKVLKHLDLYKTIKTAHYELRYDPKTDAILAKYMSEYLESLYDNYAKQFSHAPKDPILVEVFNNHEMFSGRTIALPDLHTIGACTGKMFAMVSPKGRGIGKMFNWGRVLRHELVHIFNLEQTDMQVPHWLTEGLAVANEGFPRPPLWNQILAQRVADDKLLNLDNVMMAFVKPADQLEWTLAYCQSNLYVEYAKKTYGDKVVGEFLAAYALGMSDEDAIKKVCKVDKAAFEKGYKEFLKEIVKGMKVVKSGGKPLTLAQLQAEHEKTPDDVEIAAKLAERLVVREPGQARKLAEAVLDKQKDHPLASVVIAKLDAKAGRTDEAIKALESALKKDDPNTDLLLALGRMYAEAGKAEKAIETFELGRKTDPYDPTWLEELAKATKKGNDKAKRIAVLTDLVATDADDFDNRKTLAQLLLDEGRNAEAEKAARDALEINLLDEETQEILFKSLKAQKKDDEAARMKKLLQD